jgi:hypothetical protein
MKLILAQHLNHPLLTANLKEHKIVKLQRKAPTDHSNEPFVPLRRERSDEIEEGVSTRSRPRMKHASNDGSISKNEFVQEYKNSIGSKGMCFA